MRGATKAGSVIPLLWVLTLTCAFAIPFSTVTWPFGDVYTVLYKAYALGWHDAVVDAFARDIEYRPFFSLLVKVLYRLVGLRLWFYKALVLLQFALILAVVVRIFWPDNSRRTAAALVALSAVAGLHTSRILFSMFPVNHHSLVILLVLVAATLALDPPVPWADWLIVPVTLTGLLFIEFGLLIPPILTVLYFVRARGATRRAVIGSWAAFAVYATVRLTLGTQTGLPLVHAESGLGFVQVDEHELARIFANAPWLFFAHNVAVGLLTVLASEPRAGRFHFIETLLHDNTPAWLWFHVLSSLATTTFMVWMLFRPGRLSVRDRQLAWLALALVVFGSGLGFLYARDRLGLPAGLGYAILLYLAVARALESPPVLGGIRIHAGAVAGILLALWMARDVETWFSLRDAAWERHREWTDRYQELGGYTRPQTDLLANLRSAALLETPDDPRQDAPWTYSLFERSFERPEP